MGEKINTPLDIAVIVANALDRYRERYPLLGEEIEEIQSAGSVPRIRLKLKSGEAFVVDITREPRPHRNPV
jgi:hypothetical protein